MRLFALWVIVLLLVEFLRPNRLTLLIRNIGLEMLRFRASLVGALVPTRIVRCASQLAAASWCVCWGTACCGEAILDVLHALSLVRVWEPVLAHVEVVAEAYGAAGHEDLGNRERRHGCGVVV